MLPTATADASNLSAPSAPLWVGRVLYTFIALVLGLVIWFAVWQPITVLPRIRLAPGYGLVNEQGQPATSEDVRGRLTLYTFAHSQCTAATCPQTTAQLADLHHWLNANAPTELPVTLLTISLHAEHDTPEVLADHLAGQEMAGPVAWHYLTGDPQRIRYVVGGGFKLYFAADPAAPDHIRFDPRAVLVDADGIIRAEYRTAVPDPTLLERDLNLLVTEAQNSKGFWKYGYEAAHLFVCYP